MSFCFNDQEAYGTISQFFDLAKCHYRHVQGSAGVSTGFTCYSTEYLVGDYFMSVVCKDVEAFVMFRIKKLDQLSINTLENVGDWKMLKRVINRMCRSLEISLQSRTYKLKVKQFSLSVFDIYQAVSAVNLLDREILQEVTVHLPFEDQVFTAYDFIPLIEGKRRQRLDLRIHLHEFSLEVLEEVRKLLTSTSKKLNSITISYKNIDNKCIELTAETVHSFDERTVKFLIDHADDPIEEMATLNLSDSKCPMNIFEIPSIMSSIASNLEFSQILSLRKVSRGIRQCVDYVKPDPFIHLYCISLRHSFYSVVINRTLNEEIVERHKRSLEQEAVQIVNDFHLNTRHQKSCMDNLLIDMFEGNKNLEEEDNSALSKFFKGMRDVLTSRASPLKVKELTLATHLQWLMMDIVPYIDAESLEEIVLMKMKNIDEECTINLDEISKTEQWIKAKKLRIEELTVRMSIQDMNILNFGWIRIIVETMSQEDITYCRKASCFDYKLICFECCFT
ncbi:hypothetical protein GCK72_021120 [Caenorhabditis remanei]|uniref:DUF38 domain-containing protein n=1 Tax=Caenorhabditis remanei TaxID=31234 RepID=A0A6A5GH46_CAERE|nr:hypothetical protein GCK72_021120 [Caenorhabditis remanei]KAF1754557.1 hypothetical protein GCK72_021120 [Caenorhabditis remanei]